MTDFFKSAFGIFGTSANNSQNASNSAQSSSHQTTGYSSQTNEFVGQIIMIGNYKLKITKLIAEGKSNLFILAKNSHKY